MNAKGLLYALIVFFSFVTGAFFYGLFIIYKKIIFPVMMSMEFHELQKSGDVVFQNKMVNYRGHIQGILINERAGVLADVYFIDRNLMQKTYKKLLLKKIAVYIIIFILGLCLLVFNPEVWNMIVLVWLLLTVHFLFETKKVFRIYNSVKNDEYITKGIDVDGMMYYRAFFEHEMNGKTKEITLFDAVM